MKVEYVFDEGSSKEDTYFIKEPVFGVFDGFNSLVGAFVDKDGRTGGFIASSIAKETFAENGGGLQDLAVKANQRIKEAMLSSSIAIDDKARLWGTAFAAIRVKENSFEWVQISDCLILVVHRDGSYRLLVEDYDHDWEVLSVWKKFADEKRENIRELVAQDVINLRRKVNRAHGALTGEEEALAFLKSGEEKLENVSDIILLTDGLILPKEDPEQKDDWETFVGLFQKGKLKAVRKYVRDVEESDPKCWKYPRYKTHDDITAIAISFDE
ncbi:MAG TPA: protein phosphatase 2C domain-containing protein [Candidatus Paceibacterota bacterium]